MEEAPNNTIPPSSARLSDRPPEPRWERITLIVVILAVSSPFLFGGCLFLGWKTQRFFDHLNGPMRLESDVSATAPNGKIKFEAEGDGTARLVESPTRRILQTRLFSPEEYTNITVYGWRDNRYVNISCRLRYGAMAIASNYLWDSKSGAVTDPYDFK